jgi:voltage-gated potassium channel
VATAEGLDLPASESVDERLAEHERRMALPIFLAAVLPIILALAGGDSIVSAVVEIVAWIIFIYDLVVHIRLVPRFLRSGVGVFDLVVVILTAPWFLIPGLGTARFLSFARLARLARVLKAAGRPLRRLAAQLGQVGIIVAGLIFTCAYVAYSAEHPVNKEFATFGDALWWAVVTITTVGYGDITPITRVGRITAVVLMFSGLAVLGVLAGALASFFGFGGDPGPTEEATTEPAPGVNGDQPPGADLRARLTEMRARLAELDEAVASLQDELP